MIKNNLCYVALENIKKAWICLIGDRSVHRALALKESSCLHLKIVLRHPTSKSFLILWRILLSHENSNFCQSDHVVDRKRPGTPGNPSDSRSGPASRQNIVATVHFLDYMHCSCLGKLSKAFKDQK